MKLFVLFSMITLTQFAAIGQNDVINLRFTANYGAYHVDYDSLRVWNLSWGCDTVLYFPDTVISSVATGIEPGILPSNCQNSVQLYNQDNTGNPLLVVRLVSDAQATLRVSNLSGVELNDFPLELGKGEYKLSFLPGKENVVLITLITGNQKLTVKFLSHNPRSFAGPRFHLASFSVPEQLPKNTSDVSFIFVPGNHLQLWCYYNGMIKNIDDYPVSSQTYVFNFTATGPCNGLNSVNYGGKAYTTVAIGTQCWLRENLDIGMAIYTAIDQTDNGIIEKYCWGNLTDNCGIYGGLYTWYEMMNYQSAPGIQGICPPGFSIPTDQELGLMINYLGGNPVAGGNLKETGFTHWVSPNLGATNQSGFTALPGGYYMPETATFVGLNVVMRFYTSSANDLLGGYYPDLNTSYQSVNWQYVHKVKAYSVRCLKD
jgi:uncharacterized protein (TIGR02145 family)